MVPLRTLTYVLDVGSYVVVTLFENPPGDAAGKQQGEIASILQSNHIKKWKKNGTWYGLDSTSSLQISPYSSSRPSHFESELANTAQDKLDDQGQVEPSDNPDSPPSESDDGTNDNEDVDIPQNPNRR